MQKNNIIPAITVSLFFLLQTGTMQGQENQMIQENQVTLEKENSFLRRQVDSLERVIRLSRRRQQSPGTISSLQGNEPAATHSWASRTGHYDGLGDLNEPQPPSYDQQSGKYAQENFIDFPYEWLIDRQVKTFTEAQTSIWSGIIGRWLKYKDAIQGYFREKGLPEELGMLCVIESGCSAKALSKAGAAGFWQFMPDTARDLGLRVDELVDERLDVDRSTWAATKFLSHAYRLLGQWDATVASYNWGTGNIQKAMSRYGKDIEKWYDHLPDETMSYLPSLIAALWIAENYETTAIRPAGATETVIASRLNVGMSFDEITARTGIPVEELRRQNPQYLTDFVPGNQGVYYIKVSSRFINELKNL